MSALVESIYKGITYRGAEGHWAWMLHRASGLGIALFLSMHILSIFMVAIGPEAYEWVHATAYVSPPAKVMEVFLLFGVLYHAANGMRIIIIDFFPQLGKYQRTIVRIELLLVVIVLIPAAIITLRGVF
jgi:succinate dehydrogenase / fumarate reductase, cytochrome b subunit